MNAASPRPTASPRPPERPLRRRHSGVVVPLVLIFIGGVFLLENAGILAPNAWTNLWRLWPLVLVLAGIELLLSHRVPWLVLAALVAVVLVGGGVGAMSGIQSPNTDQVSLSTPTALEGASQAAVTVRFGAGELNVGPLLQPDPAQLAVMTYAGPRQLAPQPRYVAAAGGTGQLDYQVTGSGVPGFLPFVGGQPNQMRLDLNLNPNVPITSLTVQSGATDARLDLSSLQLSRLDLSLGAATTWIRLPESAGSTTAHISGGASTITIEIPQGVAAQIRHRGGLSTLNVDQSRFASVGNGLYRSPDYASAPNRVDLDMETGVTTIQVS